ncbi:hypothetical protein [Sphingosinicella sp. CPCC 101087]|uniref:hypothetical protein n=1 Tax=Sphingosinicella sp. CPCC 101087 TaxID=2497754 RepID=UPI00101C1DE6|nr:hypothetical protein [Sphingosinicella sp. CPCC 101087]
MTLRPILLSLALAACGGAGAVRMPDGAVILPGSETTEMLRQCSRAAPAAGEATWTPSAADISALEAALPRALARQRRGDGQDWSGAPRGWRRQYTGLVRDGRRYIYGNFFPAHTSSRAPEPERWRQEAMMVCDGGPSFFGVEYDVEAGRFTHFGFNGPF